MSFGLALVNHSVSWASMACNAHAHWIHHAAHARIPFQTTRTGRVHGTIQWCVSVCACACVCLACACKSLSLPLSPCLLSSPFLSPSLHLPLRRSFIFLFLGFLSLSLDPSLSLSLSLRLPYIFVRMSAETRCYTCLAHHHTHGLWRLAYLQLHAGTLRDAVSTFSLLKGVPLLRRTRPNACGFATLILKDYRGDKEGRTRACAAWACTCTHSAFLDRLVHPELFRSQPASVVCARCVLPDNVF